MTIPELIAARDNRTPVMVHAPENPNHIRFRHKGFVDEVSITEPEHADLIKTERFREALVWVIFTDGFRSPFGPDEIRVANLRNPIKVKAFFIHHHTRGYSADDRKVAVLGKQKGSTKKTIEETPLLYFSDAIAKESENES